MAKKSVNINISFPYVLFALITSMIGYHIHGSIGWAIFDWVFAPFVWIKWLFCHEVNLQIIKDTFSWFFN